MFVVLGSSDSIMNRRIVWQTDQRQASYAKWERTFSVRPGDLFTPTEWPEGDVGAQSVQLYVVFEKGDAQSTLGTGILVDDVVVGRRARQTLAEYVFDLDVCSGSPAPAFDACLEGAEMSNRHLGNLSKVVSYQDGWPIATQYAAYKGLNGRASGEQQSIDWRGMGTPVHVVSRVSYDGTGAVTSWRSPYVPGVDSPQSYGYGYRRGYLDGLAWGEVAFLSTDPGAPGIEYSPAGSMLALRFANGASTESPADALYRPTSMTARGTLSGGGTQALWSSGAYAFDGAGNIQSIGSQQFAYYPSGQLGRANVHAQATDPSDPFAYQLAYLYDPYGNMLQQTWQHGSDPAPPAIVLNPSYDAANRIQNDPFYAYDPGGRMTRFKASSTAQMANLWDDSSRLSGVYDTDPAAQGTPAERYAFDSGGFRIVTRSFRGDGRTLIHIRSAQGREVAQFVDDPSLQHYSLTRNSLYGAGQLLVDRFVVAGAPSLVPNGAITSGSSVGLDSSANSSSVEADVRTEAGYAGQVSGLTTDPSGVFWIPESSLVAGQSNWIRFKKATGNPEPYSNATVVAYDPMVNSSSANQIRLVAIGRGGQNVVIRWSLFQANGKKTRIYFVRTDGGGSLLLTPQGLASGVTQYSIPDQSLLSPCGYFHLTQTNTNGSGETLPSVGADLPPGGPSQSIEPGQPGCGEDPPPSTPSSGYSFVEEYHHRDHLGSLRVVTDAGGWKVRAHDYYPFGREIGVPTSTGTHRFTGHERLFNADQDWMVMRTKPVNLPVFSVPDFVYDVDFTRPGSWNSYSYVRGQPMSVSDPTGLLMQQAQNCNFSPNYFFCTFGAFDPGPIRDSRAVIALQILADMFRVPLAGGGDAMRGRLVARTLDDATIGEKKKEQTSRRRWCKQSFQALLNPGGGTTLLGAQLSGTLPLATAQFSGQYGIDSRGVIFALVSRGAGVPNKAVPAVNGLGVVSSGNGVGGSLGFLLTKTSAQGYEQLRGWTLQVGGSFGKIDSYGAEYLQGFDGSDYSGMDIAWGAGVGVEGHILQTLSSVEPITDTDAICAFLGF